MEHSSQHQQNSQLPTLSVVVPMYNETRRIESTMPRLLDYLHTLPLSYEIVVVDDGSSDGSPEMAVRLLRGEPQSRVLVQRQNRGKGRAIKVGMLAARGRYVLFTDADLSTPPDELEQFWPWLEDGYDVVIGSRKMAGANIVRRQPLWRESLGKVFTWLSDRLATHGISDVTCGFKCFTHDAAQQIFRRSRINDWSFDAEALFVAQRLGYRIKEVPVTWHDEPGTKVRLLRDATVALQGLLRIRLNAFKGVYGPERSGGE